MSCSKCNRCGDNPCGCGRCEPARYSCDFNISVDPYDPYMWIFDNCGKLSRVRIPKIPETCTSLSTDFSIASLVYDGECGVDKISGCDLGSLINLDCLRDVEAPTPDSCDLLVFDPGCSECGSGCKPKPAQWRNYHIPDADDCSLEPDSDGFYKVLVKDDCGCIRECRIPVANQTKIYTLRDSTPDDPDYPWIYGCYNERIDLDLTHNASQWFGKYALEVTINYDVQCLRSDHSDNVNFRSLLIPVFGEWSKGRDCTSANNNVMWLSSMLQSTAATYDGSHIYCMPWGTIVLRGSITFIVPKGQEAWLRHEFRIRGVNTRYHYLTDPNYDAVVVDDETARTHNGMQHNASRLHSLQVIVRPTNGTMTFEPAYSRAAQNTYDKNKAGSKGSYPLDSDHLWFDTLAHPGDNDLVESIFKNDV